MRSYFILFMLLIGCCENQCIAQVVTLHVEDTNSTSNASAFFVGKTEDGNRVFVTAKHVFSDRYESGYVTFKGEKYPVIGEPTLDSTEDVAVFESKAPINKGIMLVETYKTGEQLDLPGYGPAFHGETEGIDVRIGVTNSDTVVRMRKGVITQGDSGCPAMSARGAIGVVVGYDTLDRTATVIVPTKFVNRCLKRRYVETQCPPGGCPIYIRPRVEQPMIGIGIPVGRPRVYGEAVIAPRQPQMYVPQQPEQLPPQSGMQGPKGDRGDRGDRGEQGPRGEPGTSVTQEQVEGIVNAWLDANASQLRGEAGPKGDPGEAANIGALERRVATIEKRKFRIQIRNGDKVVEDETFLLSEMERDPVILDVNKLRSSSNGN